MPYISDFLQYLNFNPHLAYLFKYVLRSGFEKKQKNPSKIEDKEYGDRFMAKKKVAVPFLSSIRERFDVC
jgi:hypothetical protein